MNKRIKYYLKKPFEKYYRYLKLKLIKQELAPSIRQYLLFNQLSQKEQDLFIPFISTGKEFITRSAIELVDEGSYNRIGLFSVASPGHHAEAITYANKVAGRPVHTLSNVIVNQGFLTSNGRFVERDEALKIANNAHQVRNKHGNDKHLFSEDLWSLTRQSPAFRDLYLNHWTVKMIHLINKF